MAMESDWGVGGSKGFPSWCGRCNRQLNVWPTAQEAAQDELNHQLDRHRATLDDSGGFSYPVRGKGDKAPRLTRDQKRGKFPKPGKRK